MCRPNAGSRPPCSGKQAYRRTRGPLHNINDIVTCNGDWLNGFASKLLRILNEEAIVCRKARLEFSWRSQRPTEDGDGGFVHGYVSAHLIRCTQTASLLVLSLAEPADDRKCCKARYLRCRTCGLARAYVDYMVCCTQHTYHNARGYLRYSAEHLTRKGAMQRTS